MTPGTGKSRRLYLYKNDYKMLCEEAQSFYLAFGYTYSSRMPIHQHVCHGDGTEHVYGKYQNKSHNYPLRKICPDLWKNLYRHG